MLGSTCRSCARHIGSLICNTHTAHQVHSHILKSLHTEHRCIEHLWALKQFLLLGQGDFVTAFMDGLHAEYDRDNDDKNCGGSIEIENFRSVNKYTLMSILDGALKNTNAISFPTYCLEKLHVQLDGDDDDSHLIFGPGYNRNKNERAKERNIAEEIQNAISFREH